MKEISLKARAKINISLDVINKREDGYHNLAMIMQTINLYDKIRFKKVRKKDIIIKTNVPFLPTNEKNLIHKIIRHMQEAYNLEGGVFVDLYKTIPIAAGLAGGSADAAAAIKAMNRLYDLKLSIDEMKTIGGKFGADIPYCLVEGTALAEGIGDELTLLKDFPECYILLIKPSFSISTPDVYKNLELNNIQERPDNGQIIRAIEAGDIDDIASRLCNVLESVTVKNYPGINGIKDKLVEYGALGALMSGSGSSVFGIYTSESKAKTAAKALKKENNVNFVYVTTIYNRKG